MLSSVATRLKYFAEMLPIPVVVTNQVTTSSNMLYSFTTAALGTVWSHSVNTRLVFEYYSSKDTSLFQEKNVTPRLLTIAKSSMAPVVTMGYYITGLGICLLTKSDKLEKMEVDEVNNDDKFINLYNNYVLEEIEENYWDQTINAVPLHLGLETDDQYHTLRRT